MPGGAPANTSGRAWAAWGWPVTAFSKVGGTIRTAPCSSAAWRRRRRWTPSGRAAYACRESTPFTFVGIHRRRPTRTFMPHAGANKTFGTDDLELTPPFCDAGFLLYQDLWVRSACLDGRAAGPAGRSAPARGRDRSLRRGAGVWARTGRLNSRRCCRHRVRLRDAPASAERHARHSTRDA